MTIVAMVGTMPHSAAPLGIGDQDDAAAARRDFLHVRDGLLEQPVIGRDDDDRHVLVDQRDRAVLEFAGRIAFGVDVGDFLELQRAFQRQRDSWCRGRDRARPSAFESSRASFSICGSSFSASAIRCRQRDQICDSSFSSARR
jgi:hypothetical protein